MDQPIIEPSKIQALIAGGAGAFLSILFQRNSSKLAILTTLTSALVGDYYFAHPIWAALHRMWPVIFDDGMTGPIGLIIGLLAIYVFGGITKMAEEFSRDPWNTVITVISNTISRVLPWKRKGD